MQPTKAKTDDRIADDVRECRGFTGRDARRHYVIGAILFPAGVAVVLLKGEAFVAAAIVGSLIVVVAMAPFTVIGFRTSRG